MNYVNLVCFDSQRQELLEFEGKNVCSVTLMSLNNNALVEKS